MFYNYKMENNNDLKNIQIKEQTSITLKEQLQTDIINKNIEINELKENVQSIKEIIEEIKKEHQQYKLTENPINLKQPLQIDYDKQIKQYMNKYNDFIDDISQNGYRSGLTYEEINKIKKQKKNEKDQFLLNVKIQKENN